MPIYLHPAPIDIRKSFDGLFGIIKSDLNRDVRDGGLIMFLNRLGSAILGFLWETLLSNQLTT
jgi:hypothetical protein